MLLFLQSRRVCIVNKHNTYIHNDDKKKEIKKVQGRLTFTNNHKLKRCR